MTTPSVIAICAGCAGALSAAALLWAGNNRLVLTRYDVELKGGAKGVKIVQISDMHGKYFGKDNVRLIDKVRGAKPAVIAVTGDIIHRYNQKNISRAVATVGELKKIAPVLYVSGNHEMRSVGYASLRRQLAAAGAEVLDNRSVQAAGYTFTGLNGAHNKNGTAGAIKPNGQNVILLAHMPQYIKNYAQAGYRLILCGHAHGGQWRIPFANRGIYAPGQGLFPKYTCGIYDEGGAQMIVSRGLGNSEFPLRLFNAPEIVEVCINFN